MAPRTIEEQLSHLKKTESCALFLLIDSTHDPLQLQNYYRYDGFSPCYPLFQDTDWQHQLDISPCLITITEDTLPYIQWLDKQLNRPDSWGFIICSDHAIQHIAHHFQTLLEVYDPNGNLRLWRCFSPNIFSQTLSSSDKTDLDALLGPCNKIVCSSSYDWHSFTRETPITPSLNTTTNVTSFKRRSSPWFQMKSHHLESLNADILRSTTKASEWTLAQNIEEYLWDKHIDSLTQVPAHTITERIKAGIAQATELGIKDSQAIKIFVGLTFEIAPFFFKESTIQAHLNNPDKSPDQNLLQLIDTLPEESWYYASLLHSP